MERKDLRHVSEYIEEYDRVDKKRGKSLYEVEDKMRKMKKTKAQKQREEEEFYNK